MARYPRDKDFKIVRRRGKSYYTFELEGVDALVADLDRMAREVAAEEGMDAARKAMKPVEHRVRANVPVDTGRLKESVRMNKGRRDRRGLVVSVMAGFPYRSTKGGKPRAAYALQVEYGAQGRKERPFMRPAFDTWEKRIADDFRRHLRLKVIKWKFNKTVGRS